MVRNEGINSILCIETEPTKIKTGKNNLLQPYLSSRHLLDDNNILNDTKNRAETKYLNIFLCLKSGSFWVRATVGGVRGPVNNFVNFLYKTSITKRMS